MDGDGRQSAHREEHKCRRSWRGRGDFAAAVLRKLEEYSQGSPGIFTDEEELVQIWNNRARSRSAEGRTVTPGSSDDNGRE